MSVQYSVINMHMGIENTTQQHPHVFGAHLYTLFSQYLMSLVFAGFDQHRSKLVGGLKMLCVFVYVCLKEIYR